MQPNKPTQLENGKMNRHLTKEDIDIQRANNIK